MTINSNIPPLTAQVTPLAKKGQSAETPADSVQLQANDQPHPSLLHRGARVLTGTAGAVVGLPIGMARGAINHAGDEIHSPILELKPEEVKFARKFGAASGAVMGAVVGLAAGGPVGMLIGLVAGPVLGAAVSGGAPGALEATLASTGGALRGIGGGLRDGYNAGAHLVDRFWPAGHPAEPPKNGGSPNAPLFQEH